MNKENTIKLLTDFPNLYRQHSLPMIQTCMCWGFDCGDGWFDLIYNLSKKIMEVDPNVEAVQVKEKFATLRFYTGGVSNETFDAVNALIDKAEEESGKTCENCGTKKNVYINGTGWLVALCNKCRKERNK